MVDIGVLSRTDAICGGNSLDEIYGVDEFRCVSMWISQQERWRDKVSSFMRHEKGTCVICYDVVLYIKYGSE